MSLLDALNSTPITKEWLLKNGWISCRDYSGDQIEGWYSINLNAMEPHWRFHRYVKICVGYKPGAGILNLWNKYSTVTTVEELDFTISQLCKQEGIKYLKPEWMD